MALARPTLCPKTGKGQQLLLETTRKTHLIRQGAQLKIHLRRLSLRARTKIIAQVRNTPKTRRRHVLLRKLTIIYFLKNKSAPEKQKKNSKLTAAGTWYSFNERLKVASREEGLYEKKILKHVHVCRKSTTSGQGAPYFKSYGRELVSKPAIS